MQSGKEYKVVLAGEFGSGRSTFAGRFTEAKAAKTKVPALKTEVYPVKLHTSAGPVTLSLYDTQLHAKGGLPDQAFFRTADAAIVFYDTTKESSYQALEKWYDATTSANSRKGSAPLPIMIVGTKIDDTKNRDVKISQVDFAKKRGLPYFEISSKANYGVKELVLSIVKSLLGDGTQLTSAVELAKADAEVDETAAEQTMKEYEEASK